MRHQNRANLRIHILITGFAWLTLITALSQVPVPLPASVPALFANLGTLFALLLCGCWLFVDGPTALLGLLAAGALAVVPGSPFGHAHGLFVGAALPALLITLALLSALLSHIYYHEHAIYVPAMPMDWLALIFFGPLIFTLLTLLRGGYRPALSRRLESEARAQLMPRRGGPIHNWGKSVFFEPQLVAAPQTMADLHAAVRLAIREQRRVRIMGCGMTWSSFCATPDMLIFSERLNRVEVDLSDPAHPAVWAEAGATNRDVNAVLRQHGLHLPWNVVLENVTLAGTTSLGTHGSGKDTACMGDLVEAFEVIDAQGAVRVLSEQTLGKEGMAAARVGLGLFGVICRVRLRVEKAYLVEQRDELLPMDQALTQLESLVQERDSVEVYWAPFTDQVWLRSFTRTDKPPTRAQHGTGFILRNLVDMLIFTTIHRFVYRFTPRLMPGLLRLMYLGLELKRRVLPLMEAHHYRRWCEVRQCSCTEIGFKTDAGFQNVRQAILEARQVIEDYAARGSYPLNMLMNVRFIGPSSGLLSAAYGPGLTCYIEILSFGRPEKWQEASAKVAARWMQHQGAVPHWPKEFEHVPGALETGLRNLGDRVTRFRDVLRQSGVDPHGMFVNPLAARILRPQADTRKLALVPSPGAAPRPHDISPPRPPLSGDQAALHPALS
jgi:FAD/FMN-containing dehydrogenase